MTQKLEVMRTQLKENIAQLIAADKLEAAQALLMQYMSMAPDDVEAFSMRAVILLKQERLEEAQAIVNQGLAIVPTDFDLLYNQAFLAELKEEYEIAGKLYLQLSSSLQPTEKRELAAQGLKRMQYKMPQMAEASKRPHAVFFVKQGMDSFLNEVIEGVSADYTTEKVIVTQFEQIEPAMIKADICWFEWCDELIAFASKLDVAKQKRILCRVHSYEAFTDYPHNVNWAVVERVIFVAKHIRDAVLAETPSLELKKTVVVPNGIDVAKYSFQEHRNGFAIAYAGYINYKKGPMLLLHAFKAIHDRDSRYRLYIAGTFQDARYVLYFRQMIQEWGLEDAVVYQGWQDDLDAWLSDKDYILCTSVLESQNMSVMQAMAKGIKPLIHNFVGARDIYPAEYIWSTIDDCVSLVADKAYESRSYRDFVASRYSLAIQLQKLRDLFTGTTPLTEETFDYAEYWNRRLNQKFDIEGVGYIGLGTTYNQQLYKTRTEILAHMLTQLFPTGLKHKRVLELGPGIGMFTQYFHAAKTKYEAIDIAEKSVEKLKKQYRTHRFTQGDVSNSALYAKNAYDLVFAADVLLHLTDEKKYKTAIANISDGLKENGYAILYDPITLIQTKSAAAHVSIRALSYVEAVCAAAGLDVVCCLPCSFFMNNPFDYAAAPAGATAAAVFQEIQTVFGQGEMAEQEKTMLAQWLAVYEKEWLMESGVGFSQKVIVLKKNSNPVETSLTIKNVWNIDQLRAEGRRLDPSIQLLAAAYPPVARLQSLIETGGAGNSELYREKVEEPLVSVCIINYNYEKYLEQAIQSVVEQTYKNIEIIVIDDCSTDGSAEIVRRYCSQYPHIRGIYNEPNQGYHYGISNFIETWCNGKYFVVLSADDMLAHEQTIATFVAVHERETEPLDFIYGDQIVIDKDSQVIEAVRFNYIKPEDVVRQTFGLASGVLPILFAMHKTSSYRNNGYNWERINGVATDAMNALVAVKRGMKYAKADAPIFKYRKHTENATFNLELRLHDLYGVLEYIIDNFERQEYVPAEVLQGDQPMQEKEYLLYMSHYFYSVILHYCRTYRVYGTWSENTSQQARLKYLLPFKQRYCEYSAAYLMIGDAQGKEMIQQMQRELEQLYGSEQGNG